MKVANPHIVSDLTAWSPYRRRPPVDLSDDLIAQGVLAHNASHFLTLYYGWRRLPCEGIVVGAAFVATSSFNVPAVISYWFIQPLERTFTDRRLASDKIILASV